MTLSSRDPSSPSAEIVIAEIAALVLEAAEDALASDRPAHS